MGPDRDHGTRPTAMSVRRASATAAPANQPAPKEESVQVLPGPGPEAGAGLGMNGWGNEGRGERAQSGGEGEEGARPCCRRLLRELGRYQARFKTTLRLLLEMEDESMELRASLAARAPSMEGLVEGAWPVDAEPGVEARLLGALEAVRDRVSAQTHLRQRKPLNLGLTAVSDPCL
jgi:hypothetical protein